MTLRAAGHVFQLCPECKTEVPDWAETCPRCDYLFAERAAPTICPACTKYVLPVWRSGCTTTRYCPNCQRPVAAHGRLEMGIWGTILLVLSIATAAFAFVLRFAFG